METDEQLIEKVSYAWRNSCIEKVPAIGAQIAQRLTEELKRFPTAYRHDEEALMMTAKNICESYTLSPNQKRSLTRSLNADFYRIISQRSNRLPEMTSQQSAFSSLDNLLGALSQSTQQLDDILAGRAQPPDVDALFRISPNSAATGTAPSQIATPEAKPFNLPSFNTREHAHRMDAIVKHHYARWDEVKIIIRSQETARRLRQEALMRILEQARLASCYPTVQATA